MWGFFVLGPFLANYVSAADDRLCSTVFRCSAPIFGGPPSYLSLFNAALILAIMVLPFITAISVDVFKTVPPVLKEAAYGVGCTTWEVVRNVVIPYTRVGVIGGIMLALGRALGETMAVTFIIGNAFRIIGFGLRAGHHDLGRDRLRIRRKRRAASIRPDPARPVAVRADLLRAGGGAADAAAAGKEGGELSHEPDLPQAAAATTSSSGCCASAPRSSASPGWR